jgi:mono/diheme cytochrome c family protein
MSRYAVGIVLLVAAVGVAAAAADRRSTDGARIFEARCARCHGPSGKSDTPEARALKVRPLASDPKLARMTAADLAGAIKVDAKHRAIGAPVDLGDADLDAVAAFVKRLAKKR